MEQSRFRSWRALLCPAQLSISTRELRAPHLWSSCIQTFQLSRDVGQPRTPCSHSWGLLWRQSGQGMASPWGILSLSGDPEIPGVVYPHKDSGQWAGKGALEYQITYSGETTNLFPGVSLNCPTGAFSRSAEGFETWTSSQAKGIHLHVSYLSISFTYTQELEHFFTFRIHRIPVK